MTGFEVVVLLKRKPGLSMPDFIDHYERVHAPLAVQLASNLRRYERDYLHPAPAFDGAAAVEAEYDVVTRLWYDDMDAYVADRRLAAQRPDVVTAILADERELFDRAKTRVAFVDHRTSAV